MTNKYLFLFVFLICLYGCSGNSENHVNRPDQMQFGLNIEKAPRQGSEYLQFGLYIENGPRQGMQYFDSSGAEYNYRYYTPIEKKKQN